MATRPAGNEGSLPQQKGVARNVPRGHVNGNSMFDWRRIVTGGFYYSGLLKMLQGISSNYELHLGGGFSWPHLHKVTTPKFLILCYHRVGVGGVPLYSELSPEIFEAQMNFIKKHYRLLSLQQVCRGLQEPEFAESGVAITFDDGYRDVYTHAFPILRRYEIPATVFLVADSIETGQVAWYDRIFLGFQVLPAGRLELELDRLRRFDLSSPQARFQAALDVINCLRSFPDERRKEFCADLEKLWSLPQAALEERILTWEQARTMQRAGIEFGAHTVTHPVVSRLTPAELERELTESKRILEMRLGMPVQDFAFPFGDLKDCGTQAAGQLERCGYRCAVTTVPGINFPGGSPFALRRVQIGEERNLTMFAFRLCQLFLFADSARVTVVPEPGLSSNVSKELPKSQIAEGTRNA